MGCNSIHQRVLCDNTNLFVLHALTFTYPLALDVELLNYLHLIFNI